MLKDKHKENSFENRKREMTHHIQEKPNKINGWLLIPNKEGHMAVERHTQCTESENSQPRIFYLTKLSFKNEVKEFPGGVVA